MSPPGGREGVHVLAVVGKLGGDEPLRAQDPLVPRAEVGAAHGHGSFVRGGRPDDGPTAPVSSVGSPKTLPTSVCPWPKFHVSLPEKRLLDVFTCVIVPSSVSGPVVT